MAQLLVVASLRGSHSTGVAGINSRIKRSIISKCVGGPYDLFQQKSYDEAVSYQATLVIGHGRHATNGEITKANAHPFQHDDIVGVHNGTLTNKLHLEELTGLKFGTDSEALYAAIAADGIEGTLAETRGAYALTYYDRSDNTFNVIRNDERPLWFAYNEACSKMYWASEVWMLREILKRNEISLFKDEQGYSFWQFEKDVLHKFSIPVSSNEKVQLLEQKKIEGGTALKAVVPFQSRYNAPWEGWSRLDETDRDSTKTPVEFTTTEPSTPASVTVESETPSSRNPKPLLCLVQNNKSEPSEESEPLIEGCDGRFLSKAEFEKATKFDCEFCQSSVEFTPGLKLKWLGHDSFLCNDCWPWDRADKDHPLITRVE